MTNAGNETISYVRYLLKDNSSEKINRERAEYILNKFIKVLEDMEKKKGGYYSEALSNKQTKPIKGLFRKGKKGEKEGAETQGKTEISKKTTINEENHLEMPILVLDREAKLEIADLIRQKAMQLFKDDGSSSINENDREYIIYVALAIMSLAKGINIDENSEGKKTAHSSASEGEIDSVVGFLKKDPDSKEREVFFEKLSENARNAWLDKNQDPIQRGDFYGLDLDTESKKILKGQKGINIDLEHKSELDGIYKKYTKIYMKMYYLQMILDNYIPDEETSSVNEQTTSFRSSLVEELEQLKKQIEEYKNKYIEILTKSSQKERKPIIPFLIASGADNGEDKGSLIAKGVAMLGGSKGKRAANANNNPDNSAEGKGEVFRRGLERTVKPYILCRFNYWPGMFMDFIKTGDLADYDEKEHETLSSFKNILVEACNGNEGDEKKLYKHMLGIVPRQLISEGRVNKKSLISEAKELNLDGEIEEIFEMLFSNENAPTVDEYFRMILNPNMKCAEPGLQANKGDLDGHTGH